MSGLNNRIPTKITIDVRFPETPPPPGKPDVLDGWPLIYLIECILCQNKPYVGKSEPPSNLRTNNHRSDAKKPDSIAVDKHFFENKDHNFEKHAKITLIERLENATHMTDQEITHNLEKREDFWIKKLNTLTPNGFNQELNFSEE